MPFTDILEKYAAFGGKNVTFGSDAHSAARYCENADLVENIIKRLNFTVFG